MTYGQLSIIVIQKLENIYGLREAKSIQRYLFSSLEDRSATQWLLIQDQETTEDFERQVLTMLPELIQKMPVQYVVKKSWFNNLPFIVTPSVLIPRPETEELVNRIIEDTAHLKSLKILDIGAGSGAICISLAKHLDSSEVTAIDISDDALDIARKNAQLNNVVVNFLQYDILKFKFVDDIGIKTFGEFDVIVSNPPYVKESEKVLMQENVLNYEPHIALFVKDEDPLLFYRAIIEFSLLHLAKDGYLYFEINENEGHNLKALLQLKGFEHIDLYKDFHDRDRFIRARKIKSTDCQS